MHCYIRQLYFGIHHATDGTSDTITCCWLAAIYNGGSGHSSSQIKAKSQISLFLLAEIDTFDTFVETMVDKIVEFDLFLRKSTFYRKCGKN